MKLKNFWDLFEFFSLSQMVREFLPGPGNSGGGAAAVLWTGSTRNLFSLILMVARHVKMRSLLLALELHRSSQKFQSENLEALLF